MHEPGTELKLEQPGTAVIRNAGLRDGGWNCHTLLLNLKAQFSSKSRVPKYLHQSDAHTQRIGGDGVSRVGLHWGWEKHSSTEDLKFFTLIWPLWFCVSDNPENQGRCWEEGRSIERVGEAHQHRRTCDFHPHSLGPWDFFYPSFELHSVFDQSLADDYVLGILPVCPLLKPLPAVEAQGLGSKNNNNNKTVLANHHFLKCSWAALYWDFLCVPLTQLLYALLPMHCPTPTLMAPAVF